MQIDLLYFDDCPSWQSALGNLQAALVAEDMEADIHLVKVDGNKEAPQLKFLGSPSFQVKGEDWCPEERKRYNLSCRVYTTPQGIKGVLTEGLLREKLLVAHAFE